MVNNRFDRQVGNIYNNGKLKEYLPILAEIKTYE
jgi:hypothetical protein